VYDLILSIVWVSRASLTWRKNMHIISWIAAESQLGKLRNYVLMQVLTESSTLRVGAKFKKPSPRIIHRYGSRTGKYESSWRRENNRLSRARGLI